MLLRMATFGALGYAAYNYYTKNREQVDGALRRFTDRAKIDQSDNSPSGVSPSGEGTDIAGGPLSSEAKLLHAGEGPLASTT